MVTGARGETAHGDPGADRQGVHLGAGPYQEGQRYLEDVLWVAESVYDGTWGGGPVPRELADFEMCLAFQVSWREWKEETPLYVQRVFTDLLNTKRRIEADVIERERRKREGGFS